METHGIEVQETVPASRKLGRPEALAMAHSAQRLIAAKGKGVTTLELPKDAPTEDTIAALMLGPTGNLRAPTMRVGETVLIGYNEAAFTQVLSV